MRVDDASQHEASAVLGGIIFLHISLLSEPLIYLVIALLLKSGFGFEGLMPAVEDTSLLRWIFMAASAVLAVLVLLLQHSFLAKERFGLNRAVAEEILSQYSRAQIVLDALAAAPATFGFVSFLLSGDMSLLIALAALSVFLLIVLYPRAGRLHDMMNDRAMSGGGVQAR